MSMCSNIMQYPTRVGKDGRISIPKSIRDFLRIEENDEILVDVVKKDSVEDHKRSLEKPYRRE